MLVNTGIASTISEFVAPCIPEVITDLLISLNALGTYWFCWIILNFLLH